MEYTGLRTLGSPRTTGALAIGFASTWLVFPWVIGPLGLLREFWSWAVLLAILWVSVRQRPPQTHVLHTLGWGLLLAALVNSGEGVVQAYTQWQSSPASHASPVYGLLHQRNQFASLCLMGLAACAWAAGTHFQSSQAVRILSLSAAMCLGAAVSLSGSRTGLLGLLMLWLGHEALARRRVGTPGARAPRWELRAGILGYLLALLPALAGPGHAIGILARQDTQEGFGLCHSRLSLWANVLTLIRQKPWGGWGWGELDFAHFTTLFSGERFCELLSNAHNLPLHLAVELGIPWAVLLCALALWCIKSAQPWREHNPNRLLAWGVLLVIGVHSLLEYPLWYGPFQVSTLLCLWVLARTPRQATTGPATAPQALPAPVALGLQWALGCGLLLTAFAAADYYRASQIYLPPAHRMARYQEATQQKIQQSVFFQGTLDFAQLGLTEVTAANAEQTHALALKLLHFSPEAMVVQKLLDSARLLGRQDEYDYYQPRFAAAYPDAFLQWKTHQPSD